MVLANGIVPVIIFWAIIGGLGASLLLPSMQSLIHGNFEGAAQRRVYALVGAAAAIAAAIGPLVGGFITTFLSWRVGFALEIVVIAVVLGGIGMVKDVAYTGSRAIDFAGALFSILGMGGIVLGVLIWQEGGERVALVIAIGVASLAALTWWLQKRKREGKPVLIDPILFASKIFRLGITGGMMIALPIFLQMVLEYNALQAGLSLAPLSLSMFFVAILAGRRAGNRRPAVIIRWGFVLLVVGIASLLPFVPRVDSGWWLAIPLAIAGSGLGLLVSQLNNYTLAPIEPERISEAAGVNSAGGSFGLSFGLAVAGAVMLATLAFSFTNLAESSEVLSPEEAQQVATALDEDAQLMSNTGLEEAIVGQPPDVEAEIIRINTEARPISLQVALLVPLIAGLIGLFNSFRMVGLPDVKPKADLEGYSLG
jgi:Major Facilitator Superfamily